MGENDQIKAKKLVVNEKKKVFVLGDGMVKHIQGWDITKKIENKQKVYIRQFAGSKVICMNNYVKPCIPENNPNHIIFHVGTNDIPASRDPPASQYHALFHGKISGITRLERSMLACMKMIIFRSLTIVDQLILEKISIIVNYI